jgi:hypothetical protein
MKPLGIFFAVSFMGIGAVLSWISYQNLTTAKSSDKWIQSQFVVSKVDYKRTSRDRRTSNAPVVTYRYEVNGKSFQSDVRSFGYESTADEIFRDYPEGKVVKVYYNPDNPAEATLIKGVHTWTHVGLDFAILIFICGLVYFVSIVVRLILNRENSYRDNAHR